MLAVISVGIVFLMVGLVAKNAVTNHQREQKVSVPQSTVSGSSMTAGPVTEAAISEVETEPKEELPKIQKITVDVTGLNPFLSKDETIEPEQALAFIKEWTEEYLADNYEYALSVHKDRDHLHISDKCICYVERSVQTIS